MKVTKNIRGNCPYCNSSQLTEDLSEQFESTINDPRRTVFKCQEEGCGKYSIRNNINQIQYPLCDKNNPNSSPGCTCCN